MVRPITIPVAEMQVPADLLRLALPRSVKVVLVLDLVESVRLINVDESGTITRWHDFVQRAQSDVIARYRGRLVKSLGDGMMVEFEQPRDAVNASFALHSLLDGVNSSLVPELRMFLRAGINCSVVYTDQHDIYGAGVNLAARIATLAGPNETVISAAMRDSLTDGFDATLTDLGECFLKHVDQPVRVYRVGPAGPASVLFAQTEYGTFLQPTVVVIPFESRSKEPEHFTVGDLIADVVISQLSRTSAFRVISLLSSNCFRDRPTLHQEMRSYLAANFALRGRYLNLGDKLRVSAELVDLGNDEVIWAETIVSSIPDLLSDECEVGRQLASAVEQKLLNIALQRVHRNPLPTLASYSLLLAGVGLMHQSTRADFELSRRVLDQLVERHARSPIPRAWLAQWHVLKVTRGFAEDIALEGRLAMDQTRRALDVDPVNSLALAMEGFVCCHLKQDLNLARDRLAQACSANPNEALAWLFQSVVSSFAGDAAEAMEASGRALALSPLDPLRYYYESLAASSALCAGQYERARALCENSLRQNRTHASTHRALITALMALGEQERASSVASDLMRLAPGFSVNAYRRHSVSNAFPFGQQVAQALLDAGIPLE